MVGMKKESFWQEFFRLQILRKEWENSSDLRDDVWDRGYFIPYHPISPFRVGNDLHGVRGVRGQSSVKKDHFVKTKGLWYGWK